MYRDSREEKGGWTTDDQMSPKEQSSSPEQLPKSTTKSDEEDLEAMLPTQPIPLTPGTDSLERLKEICNKSMPRAVLNPANDSQIEPSESIQVKTEQNSTTSVKNSSGY